MSQHEHKIDERRLAERLREEAKASDPQFSELLHARVMRALEQGGRTEMRLDAPPRRLRMPWLVTAAASVVLAAGAWLLVQRGGTPGTGGGPTPAPGPIARATELPVPTLESMLRTAVSPPAQLTQALQRSSFAYLDQDARRLADFLLHQVPTPAIPARNGPAPAPDTPDTTDPTPDGRTQLPAFDRAV